MCTAANLMEMPELHSRLLEERGIPPLIALCCNIGNWNKYYNYNIITIVYCYILYNYITIYDYYLFIYYYLLLIL